MSEEQPEERMGSDSEDHSVGHEPQEETGPGSAEEQMVSESAEAPIEDTAGQSSEEESETAVDQQGAAESAGDSDEEVARVETSEPKEESRFGRFLKRALRWAVVVLAIFTLGVIAMQLVRVRPLNDEKSSLEQSLTEAQSTQQDLQAELDRLEGVEAENQELSQSLKQLEARLAVLNILVDVTRAQLALAQENPTAVAAALQETGDRLNLIVDLVATDELTGLRERLVLVLSEVDGDPFAAQRDLEVLANTLLAIESELASE